MTNYKLIPDYNGLYRVSDCGKIQTKRRRGTQSLGEWRDMKLIRTTQGYRKVILRNDGKGKNHFVHRLVCESFLPNTDGKPFVNHKDLNKVNNHTSNLEWVTAKENTVHAFSCGAVARKGESNSGAKLDNIKVLVVKTLIGCGWRNRDIAPQMGVAQNTISAIRTGKSWGHL